MDELAKRFADIATQYAPQVVDAAKQSVVISCYSTVLYVLVWIVLGAGFLKTAACVWKKHTYAGSPG